MNKSLFVTGIGTDVGKTVISAILCEALQADYWKPIQAGDLDNSDTHKLKRWVMNPKTVFHPNSYALNTPMSPDAAAEIDEVEIRLDEIHRPQTDNHLIIEGAGGLLVPINNIAVIADLIAPNDHVILVCNHYLGSINHTLLSTEYLNARSIPFSLIFNGETNPNSVASILKRSQAPVLAHIEHCEELSSEFISQKASLMKKALSDI